MKHIGIVSITIVGAAACAKAIVSICEEQYHSKDHPVFTLHALSFGQYKQYMLAGDDQAVVDMIVASVEVLERAGANFVIMPSNTPHIVYQQVQQRIHIPFLNLIDLTVQACINSNYKKVCVLGTTMTAQSGLYHKALIAQGLEPVLPEENVQTDMHDIIQHILIPQKDDPIRIENLITQLNSISCDAFILGCTELPEILNAENLGKPVVDTTYLLSQKAVEYAYQM